jgi:hypothetical protein
LRAPDPTAPAHVAAGERAVRVSYAVLAGYGLTGDQLIDATRALRSALHGFVAPPGPTGGIRYPRCVAPRSPRMCR